jgi:uncharacterized membrane protein YfcA
LDVFWTFALVGFLAQLIDGALGMGFGVISSSVLLGQGVSPALVSASVNAAKIPTTGTAAFSHFINKNLNRETVIALCLYGAIGGILGMAVLTSLKGPALNYLVMAYLYFIGVLIIWRGVTGTTPRLLSAAYKRLVGFVGGLVEGIGGSWGPIVTTSLLGSGTESRYAIGSSNFAEFFVSVVVFLAYLIAFAVGHWDGGTDWKAVAYPVAGLVAGGIPAALLGGWLARIAPKRPLTVAVGVLAVGIAVYRMRTG